MMGDLMKRTPAVNKPTVRRILEAWVTASWVIASEIVGSLEAIFVQFVYKGVCGGEVMGERSEKKKKKKGKNGWLCWAVKFLFWRRGNLKFHDQTVECFPTT